MASISETELQRRLRSLERGVGFGANSYSGIVDPAANGSYKENDTYYNAATNNLWIFSGGAWSLANKQLHIRYADTVTNVSEQGLAANQVDVVQFSELPFSPSGVQKPWRGLWWGSVVASTDPTDYEWTYTSGAGSISVGIYSSNGTVFRNDTGSTTLRADVAIGGELQNDTAHLSYKYKWAIAGDVICVDSNGNIVSDGLGTIYTDTVAVTCQSRSLSFHRADTDNSTASLNFRQMNLSADDIDNVKTIRCEVSNIP